MVTCRREVEFSVEQVSVIERIMELQGRSFDEVVQDLLAVAADALYKATRDRITNPAVDRTRRHR